MRKSFKFLSCLLLGVLFFVKPTLSNAAALYIDPAFSEINRGDSITMAVRLDVDEEAEECVNAVDGVLTYTSNIEPVDVSIGDSIFNIWIEQPVINRDNHTITFAGGIPNGYCGRVIGDPRLTNTLAKVVFRSPGFSVGGSNDTVATVHFEDTSTALLNDGFGTKAKLLTYGAQITLNPKAGVTMSNPWQEEVSVDVIKPEKFSIELIKGDGNFSNKYYILFNTSDKQSGIDHYEVMEEALTQVGSFQWGRADAPWIIAENPPVYTLNDQSLNSIIRVKAVDKAGNEYLANLVPDESMRTLSQTQVFNIAVGGGFVVLVLVVGIAVIISVRKRRRRKAKLNSDEDLLDEELDSEKYNEL